LFRVLKKTAVLILLTYETAIDSVGFEVSTTVTMKNTVFWDVSRVALERIEVLVECIASIIRVTGICELGTLAVPLW
jgi:hypothetical protein